MTWRLIDAEKHPPLLGDAKHAAFEGHLALAADSGTSATAALVDSNSTSTATQRPRGRRGRIAGAVGNEAPSFDRHAAARGARPAPSTPPSTPA